MRDVAKKMEAELKRPITPKQAQAAEVPKAAKRKGYNRN